MARFEMLDIEGGALGGAAVSADMFYELGMMYSTGRSVPADLVSAHKWFNIAAMRGNRDAIRLRREVMDPVHGSVAIVDPGRATRAESRIERSS